MRKILAVPWALVRPDLSPAYAALRAELIAARKRAGVSQRDVAATLEAHQQFWSKIESGERRIDIVELVAVADILELDLPKLLRTLASTLTGTGSGRTENE